MAGKQVFWYSESTDNQYIYVCQNYSNFTGKEKDSESGYYYFGARYLDQDMTTLFLSVDPMADKYPSISPYAYCMWNPIKLVDPDGEDTIVSINIESGSVHLETYSNYSRGCVVQFYNNNESNPINEYVCQGNIYSYTLGKTTVIDFYNHQDAENVYNELSGRTGNGLASAVEWNYYDNLFSTPSQLITSQKRDEVDVTFFWELSCLTKLMRHYHPYYFDIEYSLPSPEDIEYARHIKIPCYLDYCGKSYRYDNVVPENIKHPTIAIIRSKVKRTIPNYEPFCN